MESNSNMIGIVLISVAILDVFIFNTFVKPKIRNPPTQNLVQKAVYFGAAIVAGLGIYFLR